LRFGLRGLGFRVQRVPAKRLIEHPEKNQQESGRIGLGFEVSRYDGLDQGNEFSNACA
jgi:hypothetical protein